MLSILLEWLRHSLRLLGCLIGLVSLHVGGCLPPLNDPAHSPSSGRPYATSENSGFAEALEDARQAEMRGDLRRAQGQLDAALRLRPGHPTALLARARVCRQLGLPDQAREDFAAVLARQPDNLDAHLGLADLLTSQALYEQALTALGEAIERRGRHPDLLARRSRAAITLGLLNEDGTPTQRKAAVEYLRAAIADAQMALSLRPGDPQLLELRGEARAILADPAALADLKAAMAAAPTETDRDRIRGHLNMLADRQFVDGDAPPGDAP